MPHFYEITTPANEPPIDFPTTSDWCRDIDSSDQTLVESLIGSATDLFESMSNRSFVNRSITGKFSCVALSSYEKFPFVEIKRSPLVSISEIRINGDVITSSEYKLKESSSYSRILFLETLDLDDEEPYPIEIDFIAGYGTAVQLANLQPKIITMIEQTVLFWYENRGDISTDAKQQIPFVAKQILKSIRIVDTY